MTINNKIFVVHGDDDAMKNRILPVLAELGIEPVFTRDKSNALKPIVQKMTENQDVRYAIIILSADDFVYSRNGGKPKDALMRANQDVVFELGFWTGKLGRSCVLAIYYDQRSFRCPTKFLDAFYIPFDKTGAWKEEIVNWLKKSELNLKSPS